tara:strand:+ start:398 stop:877 length:480 start_codon:yes stop_codon:yes gene_type:complete
MTATEIEKWIEQKYSGLNLIDTYGERSFFYNPENLLPKGVYFATIKIADGPNDKASNLNRNDIYRLSFGIGKKNFVELFGDVPKRPAKGKIVDLEIDFEEENILTPHPIYSWISWVCILKPQQDQINNIVYLLDFAYEKAVKSYNQKRKKTVANNVYSS